MYASHSLLAFRLSISLSHLLDFLFPPSAFFESVTAVPTLEDYYHIDEYSEVVLLSRPVIVISYHDMYWLHRVSNAQKG